MSVLSLLALFLAAAPAEDPAPPEVPPCIAELVAYNQRSWYEEILAAADACAAASSHPRVHYYTGIAHLGLHQRARAILAFRQYLAEGPAEPQRLREIADARATQTMQEAGSVILEFVPPALPGSVRVVVQPDGAASFAVDVARLETQADGTHLWLDPGRHHLEFKRGNLSLKHEVVIAVGESSQLRVDLAPKPTPVPAPVQPRTMRPVFPARAWFAATGSLAGANLVAGVSFVAMGSAEFRDARATADDACEPTSELRRCHAALVRPTLHRGLGAGFLGVGLGVLAGSLTALAPTDVARRRVWYGELGGGLILAAAGSAVLGVYVKRFNHTNSVVDAGSPRGPTPSIRPTSPRAPADTSPAPHSSAPVSASRSAPRPGCSSSVMLAVREARDGRSIRAVSRYDSEGGIHSSSPKEAAPRPSSFLYGVPLFVPKRRS